MYDTGFGRNRSTDQSASVVMMKRVISVLLKSRNGMKKVILLVIGIDSPALNSRHWLSSNKQADVLKALNNHGVYI